ncbi:MAG: PAS domain S-box protein [bacterium]
MTDLCKSPGRSSEETDKSSASLGRARKSRRAVEVMTLESILDNLPVMVMVSDRELKRFLVNKHFERVLGWSNEDASRSGFLEECYPDPVCREKAWRHMQSQERAWRDSRVIAKDGSVVDTAWASIRLSDDTRISIGIDIRERKRAEEALRDSNERLRMAMQVGRSIAFEWIPETDRITRTDESACILGLPESLTHDTGSNFLQRIHPEDRAGFLAALRGLTPEADSYRILYRVVRPDGSVVAVEDTGRGYFGDHGKLVRVLGMASDVSEREKILKELNRRELELRTLTDHAPDVIVRLDRDLRYVFVNSAVTRFSSRKPEEFLGRTSEELGLPPHLVRLWSDCGREVLETGLPRSLEYVYPAADGPVHFSLQVVPEFARDGTIETILCVARDVTVQKQAEEALRESEERLRLITDSVPAGITYVDKDCRVRFVNATVRKWLGLRPEQTIGRALPELIGNRAYTKALPFIDFLLSSGEAVAFDNSFRRPDGSSMTLGIRCMPDRRNGEVVGFYALLTDITEHKAIETSLEQSLDELETRIQQKTTELLESEQKLKRLSSQLLTVQEDERRRIAIDVHDSLGSGLTALKCKVEDLAIKLGRSKKGADIIEDVISYLQRCIDESRRIQSELRPPMLDDLGVVATMSWFCREYLKTYPTVRIDKHVEVDEKDIPAALKVPIYRILQEALHNIRKHSRADAVEVSLRKTGDAIVLSIRDNGCGFDPGEISSREADGRGLGLSSMRERATLTGGSFLIESAAGEGTRVVVLWALA